MNRTQTLLTMDEATKPVMPVPKHHYNLRSTKCLQTQLTSNLNANSPSALDVRKRPFTEFEGIKVEQPTMFTPPNSVTSAEGDKPAVNDPQGSEEPPRKRTKVILHTTRAREAPLPPPSWKRTKIIIHTRAREAPRPPPSWKRRKIILHTRAREEPSRPQRRIKIVGRVARMNELVASMRSFSLADL